MTQRPEKDKAIEAAVTQIERQFGKGSIMRLGSDEAVPGIPVINTGAIPLDIRDGDASRTGILPRPPGKRIDIRRGQRRLEREYGTFRALRRLRLAHSADGQCLALRAHAGVFELRQACPGIVGKALIVTDDTAGFISALEPLQCLKSPVVGAA